MKRSTARTGVGFLCGAALLATGCGGDTTRHLDPKAFALTSTMAPFYDDGELKLYQTELDVNLPIRRPSDAERSALNKKVGPFGHTPWVTTSDVRVQLSWTLANLDKDPHSVEVLVDPWNEFGRYVPGVLVQGDNAIPNLSGIDEVYDLPGLGTDRSSRIEHTFSFDEMDELATDFATVINILASVQATPAMGNQPADDPRPGLVNHAFNLQNHHGHDPFTDGYVPAVIPGLLGFGIAVRTREPANVALELSVEVVDANGDRVIPDGSADQPLVAPTRTFSLGG
jgi:hypothetical protein